MSKKQAKGAQVMRCKAIRDWRLPDKSELTDEQVRAMLVTGFEEGNGFVFEVEGTDGKAKNQIVFELDKGYLRVRAYAAPDGPEEPLGELWVGREMAHTERPF